MTHLQGWAVAAILLLTAWVPLALFLYSRLAADVRAPHLAWQAVLNPFGVDRAILTPVGNRVLTALRWAVGLGLAAWALAALFFLANFALWSWIVDGDGPRWATRSQVVAAAERCGVADFKPTKAGAAWAAYIDGEHPDHGPKGDCIYGELERQGLLVTR